MGKRRFRVARKIEEVKRKANPQVVKYLTKLLAEAEQGKLTAMAVAFQIDGEHVGHIFSGLEETNTRFKFVGVLEALKANILSSMVQRS